MTEIKESMELLYYFMTLEDKYWGLFLVALVVLLFLACRKRYFLASYGMLAYALLLCPAAVLCITRAFPYLESYYPIRWLCQTPVYICIAMTLVIENVKKEQDNKHLAGACLLLVLMLCLAGSPVFLQKVSDTAEQSAGSEEEAYSSFVEVYELLLQDMEKRGMERAFIWGPTKWMQHARVYSAQFYPVYGKDMWDAAAGQGLNASYSNDLKRLYEFYSMYEAVDGALENKEQQVEVLADAPNTVSEIECDYVVVYKGAAHWKSRGEKAESLEALDVEGIFKSRNYELAGMTEDYYVFYRQAGEGR